MTDFLIRREGYGIKILWGKSMWWHGEKMAIYEKMAVYKPKNSEASEGTNPTNSLILHSQPPDLRQYISVV